MMRCRTHETGKQRCTNHSIGKYKQKRPFGTSDTTTDLEEIERGGVNMIHVD
jgi:hypothetical protein